MIDAKKVFSLSSVTATRVQVASSSEMTSWILTLPLTGGEEFYTSYEPFCGDPQKAFRWSSVKVTGTPVA